MRARVTTTKTAMSSTTKSAMVVYSSVTGVLAG